MEILNKEKVNLIIASAALVLSSLAFLKECPVQVETRTEITSQKPAVPGTEITEADLKALKYIDRFADVAKAEQQKFGIPASIKMAQGLLESNKGESILVTKAKNHFGIKCFSRNCAPGHCINRTDDSHKDFFRSYKTDWESWRAHSQLITNDRYKKLLEYGNDYKKWAYGLKTLGYATDPEYPQKIIKLIEKYNLNQL